MNSELEIRVKRSISTTELERRWKAVRLAMAERNLDFLIAQNCTDYFAGYVKWFTDVPAVNNYMSTVIFPRNDEMITIWHGPRQPAEPNPPGWTLRGVKKRISTPSLPSLCYSNNFDAEKVVEELSPYKNCRIGLLGMGFISAAFYKYLIEHLDPAKIEDATDMIDRIKAIKSDEEIELIRETCTMQDIVFQYALNRVQPGKRDIDIYNDIKFKCTELGSEQAIIMVGSDPPGKPSLHFPVHFENRVIQEGDQLAVLIEANGPSGFYGEIHRNICLGKVPAEMEDLFELTMEAEREALKLLKPGIHPKVLWDAYNEFRRKKGYPEERRFHGHCQGYDLVERPCIDPYETMELQARMALVIHTGFISKTASGMICHDHLINANGEIECLHKTPQEIFVI